MKDLKMDNFKQRQGQSAATRLTPVAMACSVLLFSAGAAFAQQAQQLEQVTVTGLRSSIETSIATKRNSDSIVEAVSSEDIGKLPETSIAESLARLPGITAQRVNADWPTSLVSRCSMAAKWSALATTVQSNSTSFQPN